MKNKPRFVHLHVHTEYSMLDGINRIPQMVQKVKMSGMNAVALTDHGVLYGVYEFWKTCQDEGIKPIIGCEMYISPKEKELREEVDGIKYYHILLLAKNLKGYHNMLKLVSKAHLEGYYYKPRADKQLLKKYSEGLICTSACPQSPLAKHILRGEKKKAIGWLKFFIETYKDDFYLELQRHGLVGSDEISGVDRAQVGEDQYEYMKIQSKINKQLIAWSREYDVPLIATTDAHYLNDEDEFTQEVVFAIKDGKTLDDPERRMPYKHTYIKTPEEMLEVYSDLPEALENTQKLADKVKEYDITYKRTEAQPQYPDLPKGSSSKEELRKQAYKGAKKRYGKLRKEVKERIDYEVEIIDDKGYSDYYLVTSDYVRWAREQNIVVSMRGSGTASVVAYCIEITSIDPFWWGLMFERFLNPKRPSPPDFDLDLEDQNRDQVLEYVTKKYGKDSVVAICTFGRMQTRAAIRDVCRVMGLNLEVANELSKMVEIKFGKPKKIAWMLENSNEFARIINSDSQLQTMAEIVEKIEGMKRHVSTHPCGVLITPKPVIEYIPVQQETGKSNRVITQIEGSWVEGLSGLMKFDFLGLANLTIIRNTIELVNKLHDTNITIESIPMDDEKTFHAFQSGDTTSVFQFEGEGMKRFLKELKPTSVKDLCFMAAAYRPGPMDLIPDAIKVKQGQKKVKYLIPELEPILKETYGAIVYQEQIMRIAVEIAGYESMGDADLLRRAVAKKKHDIMAKEEPRFKNGMVKNGFTKDQADALWNYLIPFADYGFPKAHSAMYAVVAYWTAYLKSHYPLEFMCARLSADMDKPDKLKVALEEARNLKLELLPPDINKSFEQFVPEGKNSIRYGLDGIKNVGRNIVEEIVSERSKNGEYTSLDDFCLRIKSLNSRSLESLIKVGALRNFGEHAALLVSFSSVLAATSKEAQKLSAGQLGFFSSKGDKKNGSIRKASFPEVDPAPIVQKLQWERDLLGIYFTSHPIQAYEKKLRKKRIGMIGDYELRDGREVKGAALISSVRQIITKKGDLMAFVELEDLVGTYDAVIFPRDYEKYKDEIAEGKVVIVSGKGNTRNGEMNIIINRVDGIKDGGTDFRTEGKAVEEESKENVLVVIKEGCTTNDLEQLKDILIENPGDVRVIIHVQANGRSRKFKMKRRVSREVLDDVISNLAMVKEVLNIESVEREDV